MTESGDDQRPPGHIGPPRVGEDDLTPSPRRQAWSATPDAPTDPFTDAANLPTGYIVPDPAPHMPGPAGSEPGYLPPSGPVPSEPVLNRPLGVGEPMGGPVVVGSPRKERGAWVWISLCLIALVAAAIAGAFWWAASGSEDTADPGITSAEQVRLGDCVRVDAPGGDTISTLHAVNCADDDELTYLVAQRAELPVQCPAGFDAFTLPDQSDPSARVLCLLPNLLPNRCYEMAKVDATAPVRIRQAECARSAATQQDGEIVQVVKRFTERSGKCPTATELEVKADKPSYTHTCLVRVR